MGAASCVVGLSRWFSDKERGSYYGFWSASHNIGEALTFLIIASIVSVLGWRYGFFGAGIVGLIGTLIVWKFFHDTPESQGFLPVFWIGAALLSVFFALLVWNAKSKEVD